MVYLIIEELDYLNYPPNLLIYVYLVYLMSSHFDNFQVFWTKPST